MTLSETLKALFTAKGLTIATAESCTAGLLGGAITDVPGSSAYYLGGVVSYANEAKIGLLGVSPASLEAHGAVSEQVAREMARGARERLGADVAVSITGVAGPGGGTAEKPVGLTWIGVSESTDEWAVRYIWGGDRQHNRERSVGAALDLLIEWVQTKK